MTDLHEHLQALGRCPGMTPPPITPGLVHSRVLLVGQAPGSREPALGKPFAWTAGKTLFRVAPKGHGIR